MRRKAEPAAAVSQGARGFHERRSPETDDGRRHEPAAWRPGGRLCLGTAGHGRRHLGVAGRARTLCPSRCLAGPPEARRPRQELRLERRTTAARWGRQTGCQTPRGDNHCARAQQGRSRVQQSPAGSCGEAGPKLPAGLPAGCPARSRCTRLRETDGRGTRSRPCHTSVRRGKSRCHGRRSRERWPRTSGPPALRCRGPSETEPARSKDRRDAPSAGG